MKTPDTTGSIPKPGIISIPLTQPFWDAANSGALLIQHCVDCGHLEHYPRNICAKCWSHDLEWQPATRAGTIWTYTVVSIPGHPACCSEL